MIIRLSEVLILCIVFEWTIRNAVTETAIVNVKKKLNYLQISEVENLPQQQIDLFTPEIANITSTTKKYEEPGSRDAMILKDLLDSGKNETKNNRNKKSDDENDDHQDNDEDLDPTDDTIDQPLPAVPKRERLPLVPIRVNWNDELLIDKKDSMWFDQSELETQNEITKKPMWYFEEDFLETVQPFFDERTHSNIISQNTIDVVLKRTTREMNVDKLDDKNNDIGPQQNDLVLDIDHDQSAKQTTELMKSDNKEIEETLKPNQQNIEYKGVESDVSKTTEDKLINENVGYVVDENDEYNVPVNEDYDSNGSQHFSTQKSVGTGVNKTTTKQISTKLTTKRKHYDKQPFSFDPFSKKASKMKSLFNYAKGKELGLHTSERLKNKPRQNNRSNLKPKLDKFIHMVTYGIVPNEDEIFGTVSSKVVYTTPLPKYRLHKETNHIKKSKNLKVKSLKDKYNTHDQNYAKSQNMKKPDYIKLRPIILDSMKQKKKISNISSLDNFWVSSVKSPPTTPGVNKDESHTKKSGLSPTVQHFEEDTKSTPLTNLAVKKSKKLPKYPVRSETKTPWKLKTNKTRNTGKKLPTTTPTSHKVTKTKNLKGNKNKSLNISDSSNLPTENLKAIKLTTEHEKRPSHGILNEIATDISSLLFYRNLPPTENKYQASSSSKTKTSYKPIEKTTILPWFMIKRTNVIPLQVSNTEPNLVPSAMTPLEVSSTLAPHVDRTIPSLKQYSNLVQSYKLASPLTSATALSVTKLYPHYKTSTEKLKVTLEDEEPTVAQPSPYNINKTIVLTGGSGEGDDDYDDDKDTDIFKSESLLSSSSNDWETDVLKSNIYSETQTEKLNKTKYLRKEVLPVIKNVTQTVLTNYSSDSYETTTSKQTQSLKKISKNTQRLNEKWILSDVQFIKTDENYTEHKETGTVENDSNLIEPLLSTENYSLEYETQLNKVTINADTTKTKSVVTDMNVLNPTFTTENTVFRIHDSSITRTPETENYSKYDDEIETEHNLVFTLATTDANNLNIKHIESTGSFINLTDNFTSEIINKTLVNVNNDEKAEYGSNYNDKNNILISTLPTTDTSNLEVNHKEYTGIFSNATVNGSSEIINITQVNVNEDTAATKLPEQRLFLSGKTVSDEILILTTASDERTVTYLDDKRNHIINIHSINLTENSPANNTTMETDSGNQKEIIKETQPVKDSVEKGGPEKIKVTIPTVRTTVRLPTKTIHSPAVPMNKDIHSLTLYEMPLEIHSSTIEPLNKSSKLVMYHSKFENLPSLTSKFTTTSSYNFKSKDKNGWSTNKPSQIMKMKTKKTTTATTTVPTTGKLIDKSDDINTIGTEVEYTTSLEDKNEDFDYFKDSLDAYDNNKTPKENPLLTEITPLEPKQNKLRIKFKPKDLVDMIFHEMPFIIHEIEKEKIASSTSKNNSNKKENVAMESSTFINNPKEITKTLSLTERLFNAMLKELESTKDLTLKNNISVSAIINKSLPLLNRVSPYDKNLEQELRNLLLDTEPKPAIKPEKFAVFEIFDPVQRSHEIYPQKANPGIQKALQTAFLRNTYLTTSEISNINQKPEEVVEKPEESKVLMLHKINDKLNETEYTIKSIINNIKLLKTESAKPEALVDMVHYEKPLIKYKIENEKVVSTAFKNNSNKQEKVTMESSTIKYNSKEMAKSLSLTERLLNAMLKELKSTKDLTLKNNISVSAIINKSLPLLNRVSYDENLEQELRNLLLDTEPKPTIKPEKVVLFEMFEPVKWSHGVYSQKANDHSPGSQKALQRKFLLNSYLTTTEISNIKRKPVEKPEELKALMLYKINDKLNKTEYTVKSIIDNIKQLKKESAELESDTLFTNVIDKMEEDQSEKPKEKINKLIWTTATPSMSFFYEKPSFKTGKWNFELSKPEVNEMKNKETLTKDSCGFDNSLVQHVKEGTDDIENYPWLGFLIYPKDKKQRLVTSVVLVTVQLVIASAWKIDKIPKRDFRRSSKVILGHNCTGPEIGILNYNYHPDFRAGFHSALALIQIDTANLVANLQPICPPPSNLVEPQFYSLVMPEDCSSSDIQVFKMYHVNVDICRQYYGQFWDPSSLWPRHYACGNSRRGSHCTWEAGHVLAVKQHRRWHLLGIGVSGPGCESPSRFIDYAKHAHWVSAAVTRIGQPSITRIAPDAIILRRSPNQIQRFGQCDEEEVRNGIGSLSSEVRVPVEFEERQDEDAHANYVQFHLTLWNNTDYKCLLVQVFNIKTSELEPVIDIHRITNQTTSADSAHENIDLHIDIQFYHNIKYLVLAYGRISNTSNSEIIESYNNIKQIKPVQNYKEKEFWRKPYLELDSRRYIGRKTLEKFKNAYFVRKSFNKKLRSRRKAVKKTKRKKMKNTKKTKENARKNL